MPHWKTHIEIGKELNKVLKYDEKDLELFLFGSILPDVNNGYIVKDVLNKISHRITHFSETNVKSYIDFENKYNVEISNPLIFGYFTHLYTDYYWNNNFYNLMKIRQIDISLHNEREIKQHDFKIYNNKFLNNTIEIKKVNNILEECEKVKEIYITKEDVIKVKEYLDTEQEYKDEYNFYKPEELEKLKEDVINEIEINYIKTN